MTALARHPRDGGFTLIEMIVVLVVLGMAMAAIFPAIGNMMRSNARSSAVSQASAEASVAARQFEYDVRRALGNRGTGDRTDIVTNLATIPALSNDDVNASYADIVRAGPTFLLLNSDVLPQTAGIEQVEWSLLQNTPACGDVQLNTGQNWCLRRRVLNAGGAPISVEIPAKGRGTYPANITSCAPAGNVAANLGLPTIATRVFCYQEAVPRPAAGQPGNPNSYRNQWTANCATLWFSDGNGPNNGTIGLNNPRYQTEHNRVDPLADIARLDRIVNVNATIFAGGAYGRAGERSYEHVSTSIRSREGEAYREAIMCGSKARWGQ